MLASITPLGERGRGARWPVTLLFFLVGSAAAGALLGGTLGLAGRVVGIGRAGTDLRIAILIVAILTGAALEGGAFGLRLPGPRRQVNEDWLEVYRGWVYGLGFGFQLGLGVVTVVTSSAVYAALVGSFLLASPLLSVLVVTTFAMVRAASLLTVAGVRRPDQLLSMGRRLSRLDQASRTVGLGAQLVAAAVAAAALVALS